MGQVNDWMSELYPRCVEAHGVMIVTPVYWYQAPSVLELMMDRLVCAVGTRIPRVRMARRRQEPSGSSCRGGARSLVDAMRLQARGTFVQPGSELPDPRPK